MSWKVYYKRDVVDGTIAGLCNDQGDVAVFVWLDDSIRMHVYHLEATEEEFEHSRETVEYDGVEWFPPSEEDIEELAERVWLEGEQVESDIYGHPGGEDQDDDEEDGNWEETGYGEDEYEDEDQDEDEEE